MLPTCFTYVLTTFPSCYPWIPRITIVFMNFMQFNPWIPLYPPLLSLHPVIIDLHSGLLSPWPTNTSYTRKKCMFLKFWVVWVVIQLIPLVVTTFYSTIYIQKGINRGREVHEKGLKSLHCYARGIGTLIPPTFVVESISFCFRSWRLSSLEKRSKITRSEVSRAS